MKLGPSLPVLMSLYSYKTMHGEVVLCRPKHCLHVGRPLILCNKDTPNISVFVIQSSQCHTTLIQCTPASVYWGDVLWMF